MDPDSFHLVVLSSSLASSSSAPSQPGGKDSKEETHKLLHQVGQEKIQRLSNPILLSRIAFVATSKTKEARKCAQIVLPKRYKELAVLAPQSVPKSTFS